MYEIAFDGTFPDWRRAARLALAESRAPHTVSWRDTTDNQTALAFAVEEPELTSAPARTSTAPAALARVPREFLELAQDVACYRDAAKWDLLYRTLWRLTHGEEHLLSVSIDPDTTRLREMAKSVHRDLHKMRAFVRFREIATDDGTWFVAWFEPEHDIVEANAPFFRDRFASMQWSILTPRRSVHWDKKALRFGPGVERNAAPAEDAMEDLWRTYYASIFNPARLKIGAMVSEMPQRYWRNLPEAKLIPELVAGAQPRADAMVARSAEVMAQLDDFHPAPVPATKDLDLIRDAASTCKACPLWRNATCTVFGTGPHRAKIVFVGEQPGDQEDRKGQPFVGPAGQLLDKALVDAEVDRTKCYVTNAVKHFKWEPRGKRRLHQKPNAREIAACRPWLEAELTSLKPELIVCLGATAAQSVLRRTVKVLSERGQLVETEFGARALITVHPSSLLRLPAGRDAEAEFAQFVADLRLAKA